jgi:hypothetical protein
MRMRAKSGRWLLGRAAITTALSVSVTVFPSTAWAVMCDALPNAAGADAGASPPVVYIEGANAVGPFIAPLQQALSVDSSPINVVYIGDGGCTGAKNFFTNSPIGSKPAPIYYAGETEGTCVLPTTGGPGGGPPVADIGASDVYAPTCGTLPGGSLPQGVEDFLGPIQPMIFVVPSASTQRSISLDAAYFVFGFGSDSGVAPWTVNSSIYRRNTTSATQAMLAVGIGVPLSSWAGVDATSLPINAGLSGAAAVINAMEVDPNPQQVIGILADTNMDPTTATHINILAYKASDQSCGYYPDSTATAHDKANVRDGHYSLWGPLHFFVHVDGNEVPTNPNVARVISLIAGTGALPGVDLIQVEAQTNLIPACAMRVSRSAELGPLASYAPTGACNCYFDYVATGASSCTRCSKASDCPGSTPVCNVSLPVSFCESQ